MSVVLAGLAVALPGYHKRTDDFLLGLHLGDRLASEADV